ncbi:hypothetical protein [Halosimplex sp. TS25]|uniref:hypothetical protein n=1 Tax=Halosimplex rarum TaxID=3396619 RepID=UPI0039EC3819
MHVICKDGTAIQCNDFEAVDSGVLLYQEQGRRETRSEDEEEAEEEERRATGFVPITELKFVLPDELVGGQQTAATERARGTPPGAPTGPGGQVAQQQQMQQQPGGPRQRPYDMGGQ